MITLARSPGTVRWLPHRVNLIIQQGDDLPLDLEADRDLTGLTASAQIRPTPDSDTILAAFDATVDGDSIVLHLSHEQSSALPAGRIGVWDCQIDDPVTTLCAGTVTVHPEVTR